MDYLGGSNGITRVLMREARGIQAREGDAAIEVQKSE